MPRGQRKEIQYEGKALKIYEEIVATEEKLKKLREDLKIAYKDQIAEKKKAEKESFEKNQKRILAAIKKSGKSADEILELLGMTETPKEKKEQEESVDVVKEKAE